MNGSKHSERAQSENVYAEGSEFGSSTQGACQEAAVQSLLEVFGVQRQPQTGCCLAGSSSVALRSVTGEHLPASDLCRLSSGTPSSVG